MDKRPGPAGAVPAAASPRPVKAAGGAVKERGQARDRQADEAARLQAELELRDALEAEGIVGDAFGALADYGYEFIKPLLSTGYIFTRCRKEGMKLLSLPIPASAQGELAQETVSGALRVFKDYALDGGGWKPEGGASLKTWFTGTLLGQFANAWRRWLKNQAVHRREQAGRHGPPLETWPSEPQPYEPEWPGPGPADVIVQRDEIRRGLAALEEKTRVAVVLNAEGYGHAEIAEILDVTPRAVEGYLYRHRLRIAAVPQQGGQL